MTKPIGFIFLTLLLIMSVGGTYAQQQIECGDIVEGIHSESGQSFEYSIQLGVEYQLSLDILGAGDYLRQKVWLFSPNGEEFTTSNYNYVSNPSIITNRLPIGDKWGITVRSSGGNANGIGGFTLLVSCTLPDGTVINAGDNFESIPSESNPLQFVPTFSGFGFPGVPPVDFSEAVELTIAVGEPKEVGVRDDIEVYTYAAAAGETRTLTISRASGDISIGVAVINRDTNEILFVGGMPSSLDLTTTLQFPSDGTYAVGLFRFDTPTLSDTSGAVSLLLE